MKNLFTTYLVLNLLLKGLAAVTLIGGTMGLLSIAGLEAGMWAMNYGFAAIAIASAAFWVWPHRTGTLDTWLSGHCLSAADK